MKHLAAFLIPRIRRQISDSNAPVQSLHFSNIKYFVVYSIILFFCSTSNASTWVNTYGGAERERAASIQQTTDGGYIVAGLTGSFGAGSWDALIIKLDQLGSIEWKHTYGGSGLDEAADIKQTSDGGYVFAGRYNGDIWVVKLGSTGTVVWEKTYDNNGNIDLAVSIQQLDDNGYIVVGETDSSGSIFNNIWIIRLNANGTILHEKKYGVNSSNAYSLQVIDDGYLIAGSVYFSAEGNDAWLLKLRENLEYDEIIPGVSWESRLVGPGHEWATSAFKLSDGYIMGGATRSYGQGAKDGTVIKLRDNGAERVWEKTYGGLDDDSIIAMERTDDGYLAVGYTTSFGSTGENVWLLKLDLNGDIIWQKTYGGEGDEKAVSVQQTTDGGYIIAGTTDSFGAGGEDFWVLKVSSAGIASCTKPHVKYCMLADCRLGESDAVQGASDVYASYVGEPPANTTANITNVSSELGDPALEKHSSCKPVVFRYIPSFEQLARERRYDDFLPRPWPWWKRQSQSEDKSDTLPFLVTELNQELSKYMEYAGDPVAQDISRNRMKVLFKDVPIGTYFQKKMKQSVIKGLQGTKTNRSRMINKLVESVNAITLDLTIPSLDKEKVKRGKESVVDFPTVASLRFKNITKPGEVSFIAKNSVPASMDEYFSFGWPILTYQFGFTGAVSKDGYVDVNVSLDRFDFGKNPSTILLLEWNGKAYRDITSIVDFQKNIITGRTNKLREYVVVTPTDSQNDQSRDYLKVKKASDVDRLM